MHARVTGQVDGVAEDERAAIAQLREVFSYYPSYPGGVAPRRLGDDPADRLVPELRTILPENPNRAFDIRKLLNLVLDKGSFIDFSPDFARNLVTGLGRMDGWPVGIVANQSMAVAGTIDTAAMIKARRMLAIAHLYSIPFLSFLDTPGVLTTLEQEHNRLISEIYALAASRLRPAVPKVAVIVRKGIGFAYPMMTASDPESLTFAWPSARIAFTGPEPAAKSSTGVRSKRRKIRRLDWASGQGDARPFYSPFSGGTRSYRCHHRSGRRGRSSSGRSTHSGRRTCPVVVHSCSPLRRWVRGIDRYERGRRVGC